MISRPFTLLMLFLVVVAIAMVAALAYQGSEPPGKAWTAVDEYLRYQASQSSKSGTVLQVMRARQPLALQAQMSIASFGSGIYYNTTYRTAHEQWPAGRTDVTVTGSMTSPVFVAGDGGLRPLPYPPVAIWCVLVQWSGEGAASVELVAEHQDLYNAEWIVHEFEEGTSLENRTDLARIGCEFVPAS